jgi:hypothetical protein
VDRDWYLFFLAHPGLRRPQRWWPARLDGGDGFGGGASHDVVVVVVLYGFSWATNHRAPRPLAAVTSSMFVGCRAS